MTNLAALILTLLCAKVASAAPNDGKEIANQFGDDLSFASKQVIRGFTSIFGPLLDTARVNDQPNSLRHVLVRDGMNALGKGVKASATVLSTPARVLGAGIEEAKKVGDAVPGAESLAAAAGKVGARGVAQSDGAKVASTLLNTTASQFSQANLGAILVEVALKNRIKDEANRTRSRIGQGGAAKPEGKGSSSEAIEEEPASSTPSDVDRFLEQFNEAVRRNDGRLRETLQEVLKQINPPKKD